MTAERHQRMRDALGKITKESGIVGATLITRDGLCVINSEEKILSPETFSAMTAALMGAAETAFFELGGAKSLRVTAETEGKKMVTLAATDDLLLVLIAVSAMATADLVAKAEATAKHLRSILAGG